VSTKKKLQAERLALQIQLLNWPLALWLGGEDALDVEYSREHAALWHERFS
jgi:hypothetical protein